VIPVAVRRKVALAAALAALVNAAVALNRQ